MLCNIKNIILQKHQNGGSEVDIKQDRGINKMDTEQNEIEKLSSERAAEEIMLQIEKVGQENFELLTQVKEYEEKIEQLENENEIIKNKLNDYKEIFASISIKENNFRLEEIIRQQSEEISVLRKVNEMYMNFIKFNKGINSLGFIMAVIALLLGVTAFLSVIK